MSSFGEAREVIRSAVAARAFPAATVEVGSRNAVLWRHAFGALTYDGDAPFTSLDTIFDLASLTKVICTATLAMRAIDEGLLRLEDRVADWISEWFRADRAAVTIRDLLAHSSGLTAYLPYFRTRHSNARRERGRCTRISGSSCSASFSRMRAPGRQRAGPARRILHRRWRRSFAVWRYISPTSL
jgi:CubicO group peptidase (beta-lactamase class C family)